MTARTLYDKLWDAHAVRTDPDGTALLYIDRHLLHEVTSPQAFEGLRLAGRKPWRLDANLAVSDHNVPTTDRSRGIEDPISRLQVDTLDRNCDEYGIVQFKMNDVRQGIVHVIGPEQGATLPGMTVVCGDSHTSTHGAFACLAFGIGTTEVEHVLATQCLRPRSRSNLRIIVEGRLGRGVTGKDLALAIIGRIGTAGGTGHAIEFAGEAVRSLTMEGRMTLCNMSVEAGARCGMVAVDERTIEYFRGRPMAPKGDDWDRAVEAWAISRATTTPIFDLEVELDAAAIRPPGHLGHLPGDGGARGRPGTGSGPGSGRPQAPVLPPGPRLHGARGRHRDRAISPSTRSSSARAPIQPDRGSAGRGGGGGRRRVAPNVKLAMVVPGSGLVKRRRRRRASTASFSTRDSNGERPVARCVSR
jgi:3-isopropylmalate/(R)-2-methylmalate dehydratase large subunit